MVFLLPNNINKALELWDVRSTSPFPIGALGLPPLNSGYDLVKTECQCAPKPTSSRLHHSNKPFHASSRDAIAVFNLRILDNQQASTNLSMFVHRKTLLGLCSPALNNDQYGDGNTGYQNGRFETIPWDIWGPNVTRWLVNNSVALYKSPPAAGARTISEAINVKNTLFVLDFHPPRINIARAQLKGTHAWLTYQYFEDKETSIVVPALKNELVSRLPYMWRVLPTVPNRWPYMDEQHLVWDLVRLMCLFNDSLLIARTLL